MPWGAIRFSIHTTQASFKAKPQWPVPEEPIYRKMKLPFSIFCAMLVITASMAQTTPHRFPLGYTLHALHADFVPLSTAQKEALADRVIEGEVVATQSYWRGNRIASSLIIASALNDETFEVSLVGGAFDGMGAFCSGEMYLNAGASGLFYLVGNHATGWKPACGVQSYESLQREVQTMGLQRNTIALSLDWAAGNGMEMLTITGTGFGSEQGNGFVTFETGNGYYGANEAASFNYVIWTDSSITVEVPQAQSNLVRVVTNEGAIHESPDSLHIRYNLASEPYSPYGYTHLNNQGNGGHLFHVNEAIFNEPDRLDAVTRTLSDFVCKTGVNFELSDAPTELGWDLGDGQNTISFDSNENPLSPGTVGYCHTLWWSCILGDETFYVVGEMDIVLNTSFDYDYGTGIPGEGQAKFAYVLMHELGHAMRLGHVNEWGESMYPSVTDWPSNNWSERDTISTHDRLGVSHAVEIASTFAFNACGIAPMEPLDIDCAPIVEISGPAADHGQPPHPNPFNNVIHLPNRLAPGRWTLMDITGQIIQRASAIESDMFTGELAPGCYLLLFEGRSSAETYRVIKD